jgi:Amt family ammonium transporter
MSKGLGGVGYGDGVSMGGQVWVQFIGVATTVVWSGVVSYIIYKVVGMTVGLRVVEEQEREGLDAAQHGEAAYHV